MDDSLVMRVAQPLEHLVQDAGQRKCRAALRVAHGPVQAGPVHQFHDNGWIAQLIQKVIHPDDGRVAATPGRLDFHPEAVDRRGSPLRAVRVDPHHLDRDIASDRRIMRLIDRAHRTAADDVQDLVAPDRLGPHLLAH